MSIVINGIRFREIPLCCGYCPAFLSGKKDNRGFYIFFNKQKWKYNNISSRCKKLFEKGFQIGGELLIVVKE